MTNTPLPAAALAELSEAVWTRDKPPDERYYWARSVHSYDAAPVAWGPCAWIDGGYGDEWERSILPVPSAEEYHALLAEVAASRERIARLETFLRDAIKHAPKVEPERYEGHNHGDTEANALDSADWYFAQRVNALLVPPPAAPEPSHD